MAKNKMDQSAAARIKQAHPKDSSFVNRAERAADRNAAHEQNHQNQLNPNNDAYWQSRGYEKRPKNWQP